MVVPSAPTEAPFVGEPSGGVVRTTAGDTGTEISGFVRSPRDVLRAVVLTVVAGTIAVLTRFFEESVDGLEEDLSSLLEAPWGWARTALDVTLIALVVLTLLALLVVPLVTRRFRLFGYVVVASIAASLVVAGLSAWIGFTGPTSTGAVTTDQLARNVSIDVAVLAQLVAALVVVAPFTGRRWRRAAGWIVVVIVVLRLAVATNASTHALLSVSTGAAVGAAVLLAFGRPTTRVRPGAVLAALRTYGGDATLVRPLAVGATGSSTWLAETGGDDQWFVKVMGADERAADLLYRAYRLVRLKDVGDERPFSSLRRSVEHEALVSLRARDVGVRTPRLAAVGPVGSSSFLLAYDHVEGRALDALAPDEITDALLTDVWEQLDLLRRHRIAHRSMRPANVVVDDAGQVWIVDFGFSEVAASDVLLQADVAELLASLSILVGPERAVAGAMAVVGAEPLVACMSRLQPAALSARTRAALGHQKGLLTQLRDEVARQCEVEEPPLEPITRVGARQVFAVVLLVAIFYFLLPRLADLPGILDQIREANWAWLPAILLASAGTYAFATVSILGACPQRLPIGPTAAAQVGSSFASKVAPAGLGGMALNLRFMQRQGVDVAVATSSVGLNSGGGFIGHVLLAVLFVVWARDDDLGGIALPSPRAFVLGAVVVAVLAAVAMLVPTTRRLVTARLFPIIGRSLAGLRDVLTRPSKVALLLVGSTLVTMSYTATMYLAGEAFGLTLSFATVGAVYLVGSAVATAAPTPGGLGATEAALIGGLVSVGVDEAQAVSSVFLFRFATFWLPILPGWLCFTWLRRTDRL